MPRARNIKPGYFKNEHLAQLDPLARILFAGLWTLADREGRLEDRPLRIKAEVLPYDNCDVDTLLDSLAASKERFILRYEVGGERYIQIKNFLQHQNPHIKEQASVIPAPDLHGAGMMQTPDKHRTCPADSLNLIPDSLKPHTYKYSEQGGPDKRQANDTFDYLWSLYPRKKGRGGVSDGQKKRLCEIGTTHLQRCIDRFIRDMENEGRPLDKYPYGSTFFNSGYIDYLDENYTHPEPRAPDPVWQPFVRSEDEGPYDPDIDPQLEGLYNALGDDNGQDS